MQLPDPDFLKHGTSVVIIGNPGVGKTFLAHTLGWRACQANVRVLFTTAMDMLNQRLASQLDHSLVRKLKAWVDTDRYSVHADLIGRHVELRQTKDQIEIYRGTRLVATHARVIAPSDRKYRLPEHRCPRGPSSPRSDAPPEEKLLLQRLPEVGAYLQALKKRSPGRATLALRRLLQLVNDHPRTPLLEALRTALEYGLFDLERVARMILRKLACEYFQMHPGPDGDEDDRGDRAALEEPPPAQDGRDDRG